MRTKSGTLTAFNECINNEDQQIEKLTAEVARLSADLEHAQAELKVQKDLVSALLARIYGVKSEKMSQEQLLLTFLEEEEKKGDAAESEDEGPAANQDLTPPQAKRRKPTQKLLRSLENLPTIERTIVDPEVLANPDDYRLIGQETSVRLHAKPHSFTREIVIRQTHVRKHDPDAIPITPPLEPCLLPGSVLTPSLGALPFNLPDDLQDFLLPWLCGWF